MGGLSGLLIVVLLGCAVSPTTEPASPSVNAIELPQDAQSRDQALRIAAKVLQDHGYLLDRIDHRFGVVTTQPIDSPTLLEPWRADNQSADLAWCSTLNAHRRVVRVSVEGRTLAVEVQLEQYQQPGSRVISRFGNSTQQLREMPEEWSARRLEPTYWQPMGRDPLLEERLLRDIADLLPHL
jgi:hypothetical protein